MGIPGNEEADHLAKLASSLALMNPHYHSSSFIGSSKWHTLTEWWKQHWALSSQEHNNAYQIANHLPPSLLPNPSMEMLDRKTFSRVIQCRTGHAHISEYYCQFVPDLLSECQCGHPLQLRTHILSECPLYCTHCHLLSQDHQAQTCTLIGTQKGITHLASFLSKSGAYEKH
jgi:hypothetical protein